MPFLSHWYDSTPKKSRRKRDSNPGSAALEVDALTTRPTRRCVVRGQQTTSHNSTFVSISQNAVPALHSYHYNTRHCHALRKKLHTRLNYTHALFLVCLVSLTKVINSLTNYHNRKERINQLSNGLKKKKV